MPHFPVLHFPFSHFRPRFVNKYHSPTRWNLQKRSDGPMRTDTSSLVVTGGTTLGWAVWRVRRYVIIAE